MVVDVSALVLASFAILDTSNQRYDLAFHTLRRTFGCCDSWVASSLDAMLLSGTSCKLIAL